MLVKHKSVVTEMSMFQ